MIQKILAFIMAKKWYFIALLILIIGSLFFIKKNGNYETIEVKKSDFVREVSVVGTVIPAQETNMSFEMSGRVAAIYKKVGAPVFTGEQIIALSSGDSRAAVLKAEADYDAEVARLNKLKNNNTTTDLTSIKNQIRDSYTVADDAIRAKTDQIFTDPNNRFPDLKIFVSERDLKVKVQDTRFEMRKLLLDWSKQLINLNSIQNVSDLKNNYVEVAETNLTKILDYLNTVSYALSLSEPSASILQSDLDKYSSDVSIARSNINKSLSDLNSSVLNISDNSQDIPYQEALVKSALANLQQKQAELSKNIIFAPFSGTLTKIDVELGEIVNPSDSAVSINSNNAFQIETFIPEVNIKEIKVGDIAIVKLDAFGDDQKFEAKVINIEPAQTVRDGVSTYKAKFEFNKKDERIRAGMTANVVITTEDRTNAILLPPSVIYKKDNFDYVKVLIGKEVIEKQITIGSFDSVGNREIISGLSVGEKILKNPNQ